MTGGAGDGAGGLNALSVIFSLSGWIVGYILACPEQRIFNPCHPYLILNTLVFPFFLWNNEVYDALLWLGVGVPGILISRALVPSIIGTRARNLYRSVLILTQRSPPKMLNMKFFSGLFSMISLATFSSFPILNALMFSLSYVFVFELSGILPLFVFLGTCPVVTLETTAWTWTDFFLFGTIGWYVFRLVVYLISYDSKEKV